MGIVGTIINKVKTFFFIYSKEDVSELVEIQNALICRLASAEESAKKNMIKAIREIDKVLDRNTII